MPERQIARPPLRGLASTHLPDSQRTDNREPWVFPFEPFPDRLDGHTCLEVLKWRVCVAVVVRANVTKLCPKQVDAPVFQFTDTPLRFDLFPAAPIDELVIGIAAGPIDSDELIVWNIFPVHLPDDLSHVKNTKSATPV